MDGDSDQEDEYEPAVSLQYLYSQTLLVLPLHGCVLGFAVVRSYTQDSRSCPCCGEQLSLSYAFQSLTHVHDMNDESSPLLLVGDSYIK